MLSSSSALEHEGYYGSGMGALMNRILLEHERYCGSGMDALETRISLWFGHGCSHEPYALGTRTFYGSGMDALVSICSWNTNVIMVRAWMLW